MVIRAGRGHDPSGVSTTAEGQCAVLCPACPYPGVNMSPNWESDAEKWYAYLYKICLDLLNGSRYIHARFVALDANFRLKRKNVSSNRIDPGLSKGWAYFVEDVKYRSCQRGRKSL